MAENLPILKKKNQSELPKLKTAPKAQTPFAATKTGIALNTVVGLPKATQEVGTEILQGVARSFDFLGRKTENTLSDIFGMPTLSERFGKPEESTKAENILFGGREKRADTLGGISKVEFGVDPKERPVLAPVLGGAILGLDVLPMPKGQKNNLKRLIKLLVKETDEIVIRNSLEKTLPELKHSGEVDELAKYLSQTNDPADIERTMSKVYNNALERKIYTAEEIAQSETKQLRNLPKPKADESTVYFYKTEGDQFVTTVKDNVFRERPTSDGLTARPMTVGNVPRSSLKPTSVADEYVIPKAIADELDNLRYTLEQTPKIRQMSRSKEVPSLLRAAEQAGELPTQRAGITRAGLDDTRMQLMVREESLKQNPAAQLTRYASKDGTLPQVTGKGGIWATKGDEIAKDLGYESSEVARKAYDDYRVSRKALVDEQTAYKEDLKIFKDQQREVPQEFKTLDEKQVDDVITKFQEGKRGGDVELIKESLRKKGMSPSDIDNIVLETGERLGDLVKVKKESNGRISATITKKDIADIEKAFEGKKDQNPWVKDDIFTKSKDMGTGIRDLYELPQVLFTRLGLKDKVYRPIRDSEDNAELMKRGIYQEFIDSGLMKKGGIFTGDRFKISLKEAQNVHDYYLTVQGKKQGLKLEDLSPKEKKFVEVFDKIKDEHKDRFYEVAERTGKDVGEVDNYSPLYTRGDLRKPEDLGDMDFIFRRHPAFGSLKGRVDDVPLELYEKDYRKVVNAWVNGMANFTHLGDHVGDVKYLIESKQFKDIVGDKVVQQSSKWLKNVTTPPPLSPVEKISRFGRKMTALSSLGLNYASVLKQALTLVPITLINKARPKLRSKFAKDFDISVKDLPAITSRKGDIAIADMQSGINKAFLGPLTAFDQKNAQIALNGLLDKEYKKYLKEGIPVSKEIEKKIINEASDIMEMWFGGMTKSQLPPAFRTEVGRAFNMFIYPLTSQLNGFIFNVAKAKGIEKPKVVAEVVTAVAVIAYMEQAITSMSPNWSDEKEMTKDIFRSMAGNIPILSQIIFAYDTEQPLNLLSATSGTSNFLKKAKQFSDGEINADGLAFALAEMFGTPKTFRRAAEGASIYSQEGLRDKNGKLLAPIEETDYFRSFIRGKYGSIAGKDYIRNVAIKGEDREWFVPEVEFLQNGDYDRKAELFLSFDEQTQDELYAELSDGQQSRLDKAIAKQGTGKTGLDAIFNTGGRQSLEEIFK